MFFFVVLAVCFSSFGCHFDVLFRKCWCHFIVFFVHFGVILVSLGAVWGPRASQGTPQRGRVEKVMKKLVRGSSPGGSKFQQNPTKIEKKSLRGARWKVLVARCCTRGASGPPPTMKTMVSCKRNCHFHISTCTLRMTGNCLQMGTFLGAFGRFLGLLGTILGDEKLVAKMECSKVTRELQRAPESSRERPLWALKRIPEWEDWRTGRQVP